MNAAEFRATIRAAIDFASKEAAESNILAERFFVSYLAGSLSNDEPKLAASLKKMWSGEPTSPSALTSGDSFVTVPETTLPGGLVVPAFQVGKYLCSKGASGKADVTANGAPWVGINYHAAAQACAGAGYKLMTESQALAIAYNVSQQPENWTGGAIGKGKLIQGLRRGTVRSAQAGTYQPSDDERREFKLSNGETIFDIAGNAYSWIFDDIQGDERGIVSGKFASNSPSISTAPFRSMEKGMGWYPDAGRDWSGRALVRGGCWHVGDRAGVFRLDDVWPDYARGYVGFRCTK